MTFIHNLEHELQKKTNKQTKLKYEAPIGKIICLHQVTVVIIINALVTSSKSGQIN